MDMVMEILGIVELQYIWDREEKKRPEGSMRYSSIAQINRKEPQVQDTSGYEIPLFPDEIRRKVRCRFTIDVGFKGDLTKAMSLCPSILQPSLIVVKNRLQSHRL